MWTIKTRKQFLFKPSGLEEEEKNKEFIFLISGGLLLYLLPAVQEGGGNRTKNAFYKSEKERQINEFIEL